MIRVLTIFVAVVLTTATTNTLQAQCDSCDSECAACAAPVGCCGAPACQAAGRCCGGPQCVGKAEMVDVEKHCWKIESKKICVPAVRFPWERGGSKLTLCTLFKCKKNDYPGCNNPSCDDSCDGGCAIAPTCGCAGKGCGMCVPPKCGFVKCVSDLKKETYTTQACEYSIGLVEGNGGGGCDSCSAPGCAECAAAPAGTYHQPQQPQQQVGPSNVATQTKPVLKQLAPTPTEPSARTAKGKLNFVSLTSRLFSKKGK